MPWKGGRFTPMESAFIGVMARTGDAVYSATKVGMKHPKISGYRMANRPAVKAAILREAEEALFVELLPLALTAHKQLLTDKAVPAGARVQAVKLTYDRTLGDGSEDQAEREPSEMTAAELQRSIAHLTAELEGRPIRAKDITPAPPAIVEESASDGGVFE